LLHRPLARLPQNAMKLTVGILLTTFGTYFSIKGLGIEWPHGEVAVLAILPFYIFVSLGLIVLLKNISKTGTAKGKTN